MVSIFSGGSPFDFSNNLPNFERRLFPIADAQITEKSIERQARRGQLRNLSCRSPPCGRALERLWHVEHNVSRARRAPQWGSASGHKPSYYLNCFDRHLTAAKRSSVSIQSDSICQVKSRSSQLVGTAQVIPAPSSNSSAGSRNFLIGTGSVRSAC